MSGTDQPPPPEQSTVLGFPAKPAGDADAIRASRVPWHELATEVHDAFGLVSRSVAAATWSGEARTAFETVWDNFQRHGATAEHICHELGDHYKRVGDSIDDAQHQWELAMASVVATTGIGIALTVLTVGVSDTVATAAASGAIATMEGVCAALESFVTISVEALVQAIRVVVQLTVEFVLQFSLNVGSQVLGEAIQRKPVHVNVLEAAEYAGAATVVPGLAGRVTVGGRAILTSPLGAAALDVGSGMAIDAGAQGLAEVTGEKGDFSVAEVLATGALAAAGHAAGVGYGRWKESKITAYPEQARAGLPGGDAERSQARSPSSDAALDATLDAKMNRVARSQRVQLAPEEVRRLVTRENVTLGDTREVVAAKGSNALKHVYSADGPVTVRLAQPGEAFYRYIDRDGRSPELTKQDFQTSGAADKALGLWVHDSHGWMRQDVRVKEPTLVMESNVRGGSGEQTIVVRDSDLELLEFGKPERYRASLYGELAADRVGEAAHDANAALRPSYEDHRQ